MNIKELIANEGWEIKNIETSSGEIVECVEVYGNKFPICHPFSIHGKLYRESGNPSIRYKHFKAMHDYLWPKTVWHSWTEDRFRAHCDDWKFISYAGGASTAKSYDAAKIALLFWLADQRGRTCVVASTTLESLSGRIWGYITMLIRTSELDLKFTHYTGKPPKILHHKNDTIHGMFAVAAKRGDDETSIREWIGRHPKNALMVVLDEGTDMPPAILNAVANLETAPWFQLMCIGNSSSWNDTHGALSTPKEGRKSIDPMVDTKWETTHDKGVCLFFSCYNSPAITDPDPQKRKLLGKFLITEDEIEKKKKVWGADSDSFWRFVLGFWRSESADETVVSTQFLSELSIIRSAEWSGSYPLKTVAGLDPAFSTGGDACILRLAVMGHASNGQVLLDYMGESLLFRIAISAVDNKSIEIQIAEQVNQILSSYGVPLDHLCVDANGQGRALAEVIRLKANSALMPIKIYSTRGGQIRQKSFDITIKNSAELWTDFRAYIETDQIRGLDSTTINQLTSRLMILNEKTLKKVLEPKSVYRSRMSAISPSMAHSPDEADAAALALQAAIMRLGFTVGDRKEIVQVDSFADEKFQAFQQLNHSYKRRDLEYMNTIARNQKPSPPKANFKSSIRPTSGLLKGMKRLFGPE